MPRHFSRRVGAFRVRPVPDEADGRRDTESGSGVRGRRAGRLPEKRIGRSRRAPGYRMRFRGAGAEESGGADGGHDSQAGKQALAVDWGRRAGRLPEKRIGRSRRAPGPKRVAVQAGGPIRRPESRRLRSIGAAGPGGFRKSESDGTDGRRDTGSGSGVPEQKRAAVQAGGTIRGPQGREASGKANRTEQTGAGIPKAVRGCRGRKRRHPEKTDKQAAALLRLRKYDRSEAEFFRSREKPHPIQREQKCNGSLRIDRFS